MIFVWTFDSICSAIMFAILALMLLAYGLYVLKCSFIKWLEKIRRNEMYIVFVDRWNDRRTSIDAYELTGKVYKSKHDAEIEVLEHLEELQDDPAVDSYYIKEVQYE